MSNERQNDAQGRACEEDQLNADGQTARKLTNTTGDYSIERAREGFDRALGHGPGEEADAEQAVRDNGP
jgi:hypothetical protein